MGLMYRDFYSSNELKSGAGQLTAVSGMSALLHSAYGAWPRRAATPVTPRDMDHPESQLSQRALYQKTTCCP